MSKNTESYLRYLKTFLNNNKYNFNIEKVDDYIPIPLVKYLASFEMDNTTFIIEDSKEDLVLDPPNKTNISSLYLNPLIDFEDNLSEDFAEYRRDFITNNEHSLVKKEVFNKFSYILNKKQQSKTEKTIMLSYGQLSFDIDDKCYSFPIILQNISIKKEATSFSVTYKGLPIINFEAIREIPNISVKSLGLIKELSSSLKDVIKSDKEAKNLLLKTFEALQYTSCNNLNILNVTNLILTDKYLPIDTLINHTLRSDLPENNALEKLLGDFNISDNNYTFRNTAIYSSTFKNNFAKLLDNDITFINKRHNSYNNEFLIKVLLGILENYDTVAYVSADRNHLDKLANTLNEIPENSEETDKETLLDKLEKVENRLTRVIENLKVDFASFTDDNPSALKDNNTHKLHIIKAPNEDFWQKGLVYQDNSLKQLSDDLESILIEEFYRFPWSIEIAELCKNKTELTFWRELLRNIENYFFFKEKLTNYDEIKVEFKLDYDQYSFNVLKEIQEHLETNKKLPSFGIGVKPSWKSFIREILIKGEIPQSFEDFKVIETHLMLNISKDNLIDLWNDRMQKTCCISLDPNDSLFEKKLNSYYQPIKDAVSWFENVWQPFFTKLLSNGFIWQRFLTEFMNIYIEKGLIKMLLEGGMKELSRLIKSKISKENPNITTFNTTDNNLESDFLSLDSYKVMLEKIKTEDKDLTIQLLSKYNNLLKLFSLNELYDDIITNSSIYDLLIVDDAEHLSMRELVLLAHCENIIILGDSNFGHFSIDTPFDNYNKVFNALLPALDHSLFSGNFSLAQIAQKLTESKNKIVSINSKNPKINTLINALDSNTREISNSTESSPLYSGVGMISLDSIDDIVLKLKKAFINQGLSNKSLMLYINTNKTDSLAILQSCIINDFSNLDLPSVIVTNKISDIKNYYTEYLLIFDTNEVKEINKQHLYNLSINTKSQLAFITSTERNLSLINLIKDISLREIEDYKVARDVFYNKDIYVLDNIRYSDILINLLVYTPETMVLLTDDTLVNTAMIDLIYHFNCKVFYKSDSKSIENYAKTLPNVKLEDTLIDFVENFINVLIKEKRELIDENEGYNQDSEEFIDDILTRSYIVTDEKESFSKKSIPEPDKAEIQVEDLSELSKDIIKTEKSFELKGFEDDEFLPSSKFSKSISLEPDDNLSNYSQNSFSIIEWLDDKDLSFYDYRPSGDLWIVDSVKTRIDLKELKEKGFKFSLCFGCEELPNKVNAWKLEE